MTAPRLDGRHSPRLGEGFEIAGNVAMNATTSSSRVQLTQTGGSLIIRNYGPGRAYIQLGSSAVVAIVDTAFPVDPGDAALIYRDTSNGYLAAITDDTRGSRLHISCGEGRPYI